MKKRIDKMRNCDISYWNLMKSYQGWQAYVKWANSFKLRRKILKKIHKIKEEKLRQIRTYRGLI